MTTTAEFITILKNLQDEVNDSLREIDNEAYGFAWDRLERLNSSIDKLIKDEESS
jgi:hypothetical protein